MDIDSPVLHSADGPHSNGTVKGDPTKFYVCLGSIVFVYLTLFVAAVVGLIYRVKVSCYSNTIQS